MVAEITRLGALRLRNYRDLTHSPSKLFSQKLPGISRKELLLIAFIVKLT